MSKADDIRSLARKGMSVGDIARSLGVRYQHAYNVLKRGNNAPGSGSPRVTAPSKTSRHLSKSKPALSVEDLVRAGFQKRLGTFVTTLRLVPKPSEKQRQTGIPAVKAPDDGVIAAGQSSNSSLTSTFKPPASVSIASREGFALPRSMRLMYERASPHRSASSS